MARNLMKVGVAANVLLIVAGCGTAGLPAYVQDPTQQSLRAALEWAAAEANERAKKLDDTIYVEQAEITRYLRFYDPAKETPSDAEYIGGGEGDIDLVDTYALAQRISYRYKIESVGPVTPCNPGGSFSHEADVVIKVASKCRWGVARDEKPIPTPPKGQKIWARWGPGVFMRSGLFGPVFLDLTPARSVRTAAQTPLEHQAVALLRAAPAVPQEGTIHTRARYWTDKHIWCWSMDNMVFYLKVESLHKDPPGREELTNQGFMLVYGHIGYSPSLDEPKPIPASSQGSPRAPEVGAQAK